MIVLLGIASLISLIAALVLGIRLLRLASRTRGLPELMMGLAFLVGGFFGLLLVLFANASAGVSTPSSASHLAFCLGMSLVSVGVSCTYGFIWQTFRPTSALARNLTVLAIVCILASLWPLWTQPLEAARNSPLNYFGEAVRAGGMAWGCLEALTWHASMRRRLALQLADPVVANRFLLWGIAMAAGVGTVLVGLFIASPGPEAPGPELYVVMGVFTSISPIAQWLAFFPPRRYTAWIAGRSLEAG